MAEIVIGVFPAPPHDPALALHDPAVALLVKQIESELSDYELAFDTPRARELRKPQMAGLRAGSYEELVVEFILRSEMHSSRPFDREFCALPGDEAAGDLGRAGAKRQLRSHRMLAEVERALALGLQHMARERDGNRAGRRAVTSALDPRP